MTLNHRVLPGLLWLALACLGAVGAEPRRVLLIHSFSRDFAPFNVVAGGFRTELVRQSPVPVDIYEVTLESARFPGTPREGPFLNYLLALFAGQRLDLVVPMGGPAARFAQRHRQLLFPATPMLLAAADQRHLEDAVLTTNDAVVTVANDLPRMMDTILQVLPRTTNVVVVLGNSPLEQFWLGELRRQFQPFTRRVTLAWFNELSFAEMLERCAALPPRSAIFYALLSVDAGGVPHREERVLSRLHEVANAPIFGLHDSQLGRGIVGGPLMALDELSRNTAEAAVRILAGESPGNLRPPPQGPGTPRFDRRELDRWGISETFLPPGSAVLFRQPTVWELHKGRIIGIISLCLLEAVLIALLLANLARRRRAERSLRESEERLSLAAAAADLGVWMWDIARNEVWATANWRRMFGFPAGETLRFETVLQRVHPADRVMVERAVRRAVEDRADYSGEYRVVWPDGTLRWISARGRLDGDAGHKRARMLGASVDITERRRAEESARDLTGRLITAQEEERARLARELHDDITQRLARLAIDVGRCEQGTPELTPAEAARAVREGLVRLSDDVHALSYRLHPSVLEDLGLAEALKAEAERFTRREAIPVNLGLRNLPEPVPREAALCLFRVAQEALQNVARHARARAVELTLRALEGGLQLAVRDDGRGFDPEVQRDRPSLGLASMRERVHLLGGELDIESAPGQGVTVIAWVPLEERPRAEG
jgi:PAS domain S-box-containing protein